MSRSPMSDRSSRSESGTTVDSTRMSHLDNAEPRRLLVRFALPMLAVFLLVWFVLQAALSAGARQQALTAAEPAAVAAAELIYETLSRDESVGSALTEGDWLPFSQVLPYQLSRDYFLAATLWDPDGTVLWSSQRDLVGQRRPDFADGLQAVLADQRARTWVAERGDTALAVPVQRRWIIVDVPVARQGGGGPQLVMRVARDYSPVAAELAADERMLRVALGSALAGLFLLTLPIAWGAGRRLQRRARQLQDAEHRFHSLAEQSPAGLMRLVAAGQSTWELAYANPAIERLTGEKTSWTDPVAVITAHVPSQRTRESLLRCLSAVPASQEPLTIDVPWTDPEGAIRWLALHVTRVVDPDRPTADAIQVVITDVTERTRVRRALEDAVRREQDATARLTELDDMKNAFLRAVSHELRTPLTTIVGSSVTLQERRAELPDHLQEQLIDSVVRNAQRLKTLLADLLDIDRLTSGVVELTTSPTELSVLVERVLDGLDTGHRDISVQAEAVTVPVHTPSMERVVENLVSNAIKHTGDDVPITVSVAPEAGGATVSVADEGPGIPPALVDTIFRPFIQGPDSRDHPSPGTGIGLSLVEGLVTLHHGSIRYEPNKPSGSRFVVWLPDTSLGDKEPDCRPDAADENSSTELNHIS